MEQYYISRYSVSKLWEHRSYKISFFKDVNIIIGPNASGKTTLLNILYDTLTGNLPRLLRTEFSEVAIELKAFNGDGKENIVVRKSSEELHISIGRKDFKISTVILRHFPEGRSLRDVPPSILRRSLRFEMQECQSALRGIVPAVWLPVSSAV